MSEEENIDDYLSSREREHTEDQNQPNVESSVAGGVYKAVVEGEETNEQGLESASTVDELQPTPQPPSQPRQQGKRASIRRIQKSIVDVSKQVEKQTGQINKVNQVVQTLQKQTKSGQRQSDVLNQIRSQVNQIQRQITQVQRTVQKKSSAPLVRKSAKKKTAKKKRK
jgi:methyl-accepting chemotaxis protein